MTVATEAPAQAIAAHPITRQEYARLPEGPPYHELISSQLVERSPKSSRRHAEIQAYLIEMLGPHARGVLQGRLFMGPSLYLPGTENVYQPDLVYLSRSQHSIVKEDGLYGVPSLICEILLPATASRDRYLKTDAYCRAGVPHYWIFDAEEVAVQEFVLADDGYYRVQAVATPPAVWSPLAFPGWSFDLGATLAVFTDPTA